MLHHQNCQRALPLLTPRGTRKGWMICSCLEDVGRSCWSLLKCHQSLSHYYQSSKLFIENLLMTLCSLGRNWCTKGLLSTSTNYNPLFVFEVIFLDRSNLILNLTNFPFHTHSKKTQVENYKTWKSYCAFFSFASRYYPKRISWRWSTGQSNLRRNSHTKPGIWIF